MAQWELIQAAGELKSVSAVAQTVPALHLVTAAPSGQQFAVKCVAALGGQG